MIYLGKSVGPYAVTPMGTSNGPVNVYWREFEKGYVYVNTDSQQCGVGDSAASVSGNSKPMSAAHARQFAIATEGPPGGDCYSIEQS